MRHTTLFSFCGVKVRVEARRTSNQGSRSSLTHPSRRDSKHFKIQIFNFEIELCFICFHHHLHIGFRLRFAITHFNKNGH